MDRLQRAVAGWVGPLVYALPIVEVWLLDRMDEDGADAFLVVLQVIWGACFATVAVICLRRWRLPPADTGEEPVGAVQAAAEPSSRLTSRAAAPRRRGDH